MAYSGFQEELGIPEVQPMLTTVNWEAEFLCALRYQQESRRTALTRTQSTPVAAGSARLCEMERDVECPLLGHPRGEHSTLAYVPAFPKCFPDTHH